MKIIPEIVWRTAASKHKASIYDLLRPGLISSWRNGVETLSLDPQHPVYNFLIEYYGLKGAKGVKRLVRWSPGTHNGGILLQGVRPEDFHDTLHLRGCSEFDPHTGSAFYSPSQFVAGKPPAQAAATYVWYRNILHKTLEAPPILYCDNLHEWAMQYQPSGAPPPPSAKYQAHLPLRVSRATIQQTVERKGTHCTHIHAIQYFSPPALPFNTPTELQTNFHRRELQPKYEQPACVHAHMDLLQYALRLGPFFSMDDKCRSDDLLRVVLAARRLDVAASPYDASAYAGPPICIETAAGRAEYREQQKALLQQVTPVRQSVLAAYEAFLQAAFAAEDVAAAYEFLPHSESVV